MIDFGNDFNLVVSGLSSAKNDHFLSILETYKLTDKRYFVVLEKIISISTYIIYIYHFFLAFFPGKACEKHRKSLFVGARMHYGWLLSKSTS